MLDLDGLLLLKSFGPQYRMASWMNGMSLIGIGCHQGPIFEFINHAKEVYETIREAEKN